MADVGRRQIRGDKPLHSLPLHATMLASPAQSAMPEVAHGEAKVGGWRTLDPLIWVAHPSLFSSEGWVPQSSAVSFPPPVHRRKARAAP